MRRALSLALSFVLGACISLETDFPRVGNHGASGDPARGDVSPGDPAGDDVAPGDAPGDHVAPGDPAVGGDEASSGDPPSGDPVPCASGYYGPTCLPCSCVAAYCDDGMTGTGACCGDGTRDDPEICDDGNTTECGTCDSTCTAILTTSQAWGAVTVVGGADSDSLTIYDIESVARTFELDEHTYATFTTDSGTPTLTIDWRAAVIGSAGNAVIITIVDPGTAYETVVASDEGTTVTVSLATNGSGIPVSTALDVVNAVNLGSQLVVASVSGSGTGIMGAGSWQLMGGTDANGVAKGAIPVMIPANPTVTFIRDALLAAINAESFLILATPLDDDAITVTSAIIGSWIGSGSDMTESGGAFSLTPIAGGAGLLCTNGIGCTTDSVCASGACLSTVCN